MTNKGVLIFSNSTTQEVIVTESQDLGWFLPEMIPVRKMINYDTDIVYGYKTIFSGDRLNELASKIACTDVYGYAVLYNVNDVKDAWKVIEENR